MKMSLEDWDKIREDWRKGHVAFYGPGYNPYDPNSPKSREQTSDFDLLTDKKEVYLCPCGEVLDPKYYDHCPKCKRIILAHKER